MYYIFLHFLFLFQSGGKTLFKTVQFAGTVGVFTGIAPVSNDKWYYVFYLFIYLFIDMNIC